jgi:hypothetical protein
LHGDHLKDKCHIAHKAYALLLWTAISKKQCLTKLGILLIYSVGSVSKLFSTRSCSKLIHKYESRRKQFYLSKSNAQFCSESRNWLNCWTGQSTVLVPFGLPHSTGHVCPCSPPHCQYLEMKLILKNHLTITGNWKDFTQKFCMLIKLTRKFCKLMQIYF